MSSTRGDSRKVQLQWSHAYSSVETKLTSAANSLSLSCFNGATLTHAWKQDLGYRTVGVELSASMEPRLLKRGNLELIEGQTPLSELQWSHAYSSVETARI